MRQSTLAEAGFQRYSKRTRRERFLEEMERVVPWEALMARIEPVYYPRGRVRDPSSEPGAHAADSLSAARAKYPLESSLEVRQFPVIQLFTGAVPEIGGDARRNSRTNTDNLRTFYACPKKGCERVDEKGSTGRIAPLRGTEAPETLRLSGNWTPPSSAAAGRCKR